MPLRTFGARLRSGDLTAYRGEAESAAATLQPVELILFTRGMTLHPSGDLTRGDVPIERYAALQAVPTGPIWFHIDDVRRIWPQHVEMPGGFIGLAEAVTTIIDREAPGLAAEMEKHDAAWLQTPAHQRIPPAPQTPSKLQYDHPTSITSATRCAQRTARRIRHETLRRSAEARLWEAFTTDRLRLDILCPDGTTRRVPPVVLPHNYAANVFKSGEVIWGDADDADRRYRGPAVIFEIDLLQWLNPAAKTPAEARMNRIRLKLHALTSWTCAADLADLWARQRSSGGDHARRYDEACCHVLRSLQTGELTARLPRPRVLGEVGFHRLLPDDARAIPVDCDPHVPVPRNIAYLREALNDIWVPGAWAHLWLENWKVTPPERLTRRLPAMQNDDRAKELSHPQPVEAVITYKTISPLRRADEKKIHETISALYNHAVKHQMKVPNVKETGDWTAQILALDGFTATKTKIMEISEKPEFKRRRGKAGPRLYGSLLPFSLEGWMKSGVEM